MGKKGTPHRRFGKEEKMKYVRLHLEEHLGFGLADTDNLPDLLNRYVYFFNNHRPAAALGYKSPVQYKTELGFV